MNNKYAKVKMKILYELTGTVNGVKNLLTGQWMHRKLVPDFSAREHIKAGKTFPGVNDFKGKGKGRVVAIGLLT